MARYLPPDHFCPWREEAEALRQRQVVLETKVVALEKRVFGRSSERLPTVQQLLRHQQRVRTERLVGSRHWRSDGSVRHAGQRRPFARYATWCPRRSAFVPPAAATS